jgi:methionyl-tRNA synthetase
MSYLTPVLPQISAAAGEFLDAPFEAWNAIQQPLLGRAIRPYRPLAVRLDPAAVASLVEPDVVAAPAAGAPVTAGAAASPSASSGAAASIGIEEFARLDLRIARVQQAALVEGSDKLLRLTLDLGADARTVFSGIRSSYTPEALIGRLVIVVANLQPRKMRFGLSEGMVLCASGGGGDVFMLSPDSGAEPGMRVS